MLALESVDAALKHGVCFGYVAVDGGYGKDPEFLRGLAVQSLCFVADAHKDQRIWLSDPEPYVSAVAGRGRRASKRRADAPAQTVTQWTRQRSESRIRLETHHSAPGRERKYTGWVTCISGYGMEKKKRRIAGVFWYAGNVVQKTFPLCVVQRQ